jgi:hypothetical protein
MNTMRLTMPRVTETTKPPSWENRVPDMPYRGELYYVSSPGTANQLDFTYSPSHATRQQFVNSGRLDRSIDDDQPQRPNDYDTGFAFSHSFVSSQSVSVLYTVGTTQSPAANYLTTSGEKELLPWWTTANCYSTINGMITTHYRHYLKVKTGAARWTTQI